MALRLGDLTAFLKADDSHFQQGLKKARETFDQHGEKIKKAATVIGAAAGVAMAAGIAGTLELGSARAKLTAQIGDPVLAKQLGEVAGRVYGRGFGDSAADAMLAARSVMQAGLLPKGADAATIEDLTTKASTLAKTFDLDVTQAARSVGQIMRTGLAKDATQAFDIITRGMQVTGDQAGDLLDTFTEYSTQFREVGVSGPMAMGLLSQAVKAGARDLDVAADAVKEFAIRSKDGSKTSADAFAAIGLNAKQMTATFAKGGPEADAAMKLVLDRLKAMTDPVKQNAAAVALFGGKAEDLGDALYALDPTTAVAGLGQLEGATKRAGDALEKDAGQKLEAFKNRAQQALVEKIGEALPMLERLGKFASDNSTTLTTLGVVLGTAAAAVWTINTAATAYKATAAALELIHAKDAALWVGRTAGVIAHGVAVGATAIATGAMTAAQWLLNVAMSANPIGLIILAVIALIAIIWVIWNHSSAFRDFWIAVWHGIVTGVKAAVSWITDTAWPAIKGFFVGIGEWVAGAYHSVVDWLGKAVSYIAGLPARMGKAAMGMFDGLKESARSAINWIIGKWNGFSLTLGGGTIMGVHIPSVRLDTPNIPMLKDGGIVRATPGGRMVGVAEGGQDEAVLPLDRLAAMLGGGRGTTRVIAQSDDDLLSLLFRSVRWKIQNEYGGNVNDALGGR